MLVIVMQSSSSSSSSSSSGTILDRDHYFGLIHFHESAVLD